MNAPRSWKLCSILYADIAAYSRRTSTEQAKLATALKEFGDGASARYSSRLTKYTGDGVLAVFDSVTMSVSAALEIMGRIDRWNDRRAPKARMNLRIGIDAGDVLTELDQDQVLRDVYGEFVNAAARLQAVARGVWISDRAMGFLPKEVKDDLECLRIGAVDLPKDFGRLVAWAIGKRSQRADITDYLRPSPEVKATLDSMMVNLFAIDGMMEVAKSIKYRGWSRSDGWKIDGRESREYELPIEIRGCRQKYLEEAGGGSQARYSLKQITFPLVDAAGRITTTLQPSSYIDLYTLSRELDSLLVRREGQVLTPREVWGRSWLPLEQSVLLHNVNSQPIIITADDKLILMKRSEEVHFYPGCWSVSMEEQMLGPARAKPADTDVFACAERGVREEEGCTPIESKTEVLSIGIEYANLSASFICLVYIEEKYEEAVKAWYRRAMDPFEAVAIDGVEVELEVLTPILLSDVYRPTGARRQRVPMQQAPAGWHPTARMRLYTVMCRLFGQEKSEDYIVEVVRRLSPNN